MLRDIPRELMAKMLDNDIEVNEFKIRSHYNVHFRNNTFSKGMNTFTAIS